MKRFVIPRLTIEIGSTVNLQLFFSLKKKVVERSEQLCVVGDVHGAGAQRSDPKSGDPSDWPYGHGPQGDVIRIYNFVRCVR